MSSVRSIATHHAMQRAQQRGISSAVIDLLMLFGKQVQVGNGCACVQLDRRGARRARRYAGSEGAALVERARGISLVVTADGQIVTAQHNTTRVLEKYRPWRA